MRHLINAVIAAAGIAASVAISMSAPSAAARSASAPAACATDKDFHPDEVFFVKQCVRFNRDGTCAHYKVITCNAAGDRK